MVAALSMPSAGLPRPVTILRPARTQRWPVLESAHTRKLSSFMVRDAIYAQKSQVTASDAAGTFETAQQPTAQESIEFHGVHHVGLLVKDLTKAKAFYCDTLGLSINKDRPDENLSYDGLWLWLGPEMLHLMVLPNPDPMSGRPDHGGRDRHVCVGVESIEPVEQRLKSKSIDYTRSKSGRAAVFFRDPDMNVLEVFETNAWR